MEKFKIDAGMNVISEGCVMILGTVFSQMKSIKYLDINLEVCGDLLMVG